MIHHDIPVIAFVESNSTGTGRMFAVAARKCGGQPVLLSSRAGHHPWASTDGVPTVECDTTCDEDIFKVLRALGTPVIAVMSTSDFFVQRAARIAARMGLWSPNPDAIARCRDKWSTAQCLHAAGISHPDTWTAAHPGEIGDSANGYVIKPRSESGSIGVRHLPDRENLLTHLAELGDEEPPLVQRYLDGPEFSVEVLDGVAVATVTKHLGGRTRLVEIGHDAGVASPIDERMLRETAENAVKALEYTTGPAHVELRLTPAPVVIEVNARLAGGMIPFLLHHATGRDLIREVLLTALGELVPTETSATSAASIRFLLAGNMGRVTAVRGLAEVFELPGIVGAEAKPIGTDVPELDDFRARLGWVLATGGSTRESAARAQAAVDLVEVTVS